MNIGERIQYARQKAGLTQSDLAEKLGVAVITIGQYERGKRQPRIEQIQKIADALGITLRQLMGVDGDQSYFYREDHFTLNKENLDMQFKSTEDDPYQLIFTALNELNPTGQQKAVERVEELTEIPKYQREEEK